MAQPSESPGPAVSRLRRRNRRVRIILWTVACVAVASVIVNIALLQVLASQDAPEHYRDAAIGRVMTTPTGMVHARVVQGDRRHLVNRVYEFAQGNARPKYDDALDPGAESNHVVHDLTGDQAATLSMLQSRTYRLSPGYKNWPWPPDDHNYDAGPYTMTLKITELSPYKAQEDVVVAFLLTSIVTIAACVVVGWCYFDGDLQNEWLQNAMLADAERKAVPA